MPAEKTVAVSFRVSPRFKFLLEAAAATQHRSKTNMLEKLLFEYCDKQGINVPEATKSTSQSLKGGPKK